MLKIRLNKVRCRVEGEWSSQGSVFAGTISSRCHGIKVHLEIESDDELPRIAALVRNAEHGCYAQATVQDAVPIVGAATVNGEPVDYRDFPRRVEPR